MNPPLPAPQNGAYRGPVLVDPARPPADHDTAELAHLERQDVQLRRILAERARAEQRDEQTPWLIGLAALAIILFFTLLDPGLEWLADGAPDNRPAAEARR